MQTVLDTRQTGLPNRQEFWVEEVIRGRDSRWQVDVRQGDPRRFFGRLEVIRGGGDVTFILKIILQGQLPDLGVQGL